MSMYKEIRSNVIDKLISYAGAKHGIAFLEGGHQTTRYEAGRELCFWTHTQIPISCSVRIPSSTTSSA